VLTLLVLVSALPLPGAALEFALPPSDVDVVGEIKRVQVAEGETLVDIGHRHDIGYREMAIANPGVDMWVPEPGQRVTVPTRFILPDTPREGIVLNVAEMRLYYYPKPEPGTTPTVETYPVSVGRRDWSTPIGETRIINKTRDPSWYPPQSIREEAAAAGREIPQVVPPGPENPLGRFKMRLGMPGYLIHGTNKPEGIGMRVTHGCARMNPDDIESLFPRVGINTPVRIVNQPVKAGWAAHELFVEVHPLLEEDEEAGVNRVAEAVQALSERLDSVGSGRVDYERLNRASERRNGMPLSVSRPRDIAARIN
jgi:L,D-transpeptidase ErfK/SrfK